MSEPSGDTLASIEARLRAYLECDNAAAVRDDVMRDLLLGVGVQLRGREPLAPVDLMAILARAHLARFQTLPEGQDQPDLVQSLRWYARLRRRAPDRVPPEILDALGDTDDGLGVPEFADPDLLDDVELRDEIVRLSDMRLSAESHIRYSATLAAYLVARYERTQHSDDLAEALELGRAVLADRAATEADRIAARANLAGALLHEFELTSNEDCLHEAVTLYDRNLRERGSAADFANAAMAHLSRYECSATAEDLDEAVTFARRAADMTPADDPFLPARLSNLGAILRTAFDVGGDTELLAEAVGIGERSLELTRPDEPARTRRLSNLCAALTTRFEISGDRSDIDRAVDLGRRSLDGNAMTGDAGRMSNLALALHLRGNKLGEVRDLQEALALSQQAAWSLPDGHADRADLLSNAAGAAMSWFDWTGDLHALADAAHLGVAAADGAPRNSRGAMIQANAAMHLLARHEFTGLLADVDAARDHARRSVEWAGQSPPAIALSNLAVVARTRFELTGDSDDLETALVAAQRAAQVCPADWPDRAAFDSNLSLCLWYAGRRDEAITVAAAAHRHSAVADLATAAAYAANLARMHSQSNGNPATTRSLWKEVAGNGAAPVPLRLEGFIALAELAEDDIAAASGHYRAAVRLLPQSAWHGIAPASRARRLVQWQGLAGNAAACELLANGPAAALTLLDDALSQLWGREVSTTAEEERLRRFRPSLAARVESLRRIRGRAPSTAPDDPVRQ